MRLARLARPTAAALAAHHVVLAAVAAHVAARVAARRAPGLARALATLAGLAALAAHHRLGRIGGVRHGTIGRGHHVLKETAHHVHVHAHVITTSVAPRVAARITTSVGHFLYIGVRK